MQSDLLLATNPPLLRIVEKQGGLVAKLKNPQNFPPGGSKNQNFLDFWRFQTKWEPNIFRPSAENMFVEKQGGLVAKGRLVASNRSDSFKLPYIRLR